MGRLCLLDQIDFGLKPGGELKIGSYRRGGCGARRRVWSCVLASAPVARRLWWTASRSTSVRRKRPMTGRSFREQLVVLSPPKKRRGRTIIGPPGDIGGKGSGHSGSDARASNAPGAYSFQPSGGLLPLAIWRVL